MHRLNRFVLTGSTRYPEAFSASTASQGNFGWTALKGKNTISSYLGIVYLRPRFVHEMRNFFFTRSFSLLLISPSFFLFFLQHLFALIHLYTVFVDLYDFSRTGANIKKMEQLGRTLLYLPSILRKTTVFLLYHLFLRITCIPWNFAEFQISHESADIRWFISK